MKNSKTHRYDNQFYKQVAKNIQKWLKKKFPEDRERVIVDSKRKPGAQSDFDDNELMEIALETKVALKGEEINYLKLQVITGIGRNTWARRIPEYIKKLNLPAAELRARNINLNEHDEINHTNIAMIVEKYWDNPRELINHLYHLEESRINYYDQIKKMRIENQELLKYQEANNKLQAENKKLKEELAHYICLYNNLTVSSFFPDLRKITGAKEGAIEIKSNLEYNINISNLYNLFPSTSMLSAANDTVEEKILNNKPRKIGEELYNEVLGKFAGLLEEE